MPPKKEEWEVRFEEYRDTLVSLGAKIKNEKALKLAFKIYGEERMPARIYQNCVEETGAVSSKTESPTPTETVKKEKKAETDTSTKPSTPPNGKKPTSLNSFEALADIRLEETAAGHVETTSPTEERKEKKTRKTQRERFEEYKSRLQEKGITINDENGLWEKIYKKSGQGRRTGVGITAEGDMLAALGMRYGTEEATEFSEKVHKAVALGAYRSSVDMAKERGAFDVYDSEREKNNPFINRLREADPALYEDMKKYGRRNIACLTIAPTGTTSLMTQTTSGIEPVFLPVYKRRRKVNPNDTNVRVDFVDETGDAFEEYIVFHHKFVTWMEANGYDPAKRYTQEEIDELVAKSPYYKATSNDVDWLMKVRMQGKIQKWVDHSISVTINLPNDVDEELVNRLYVEAWKSGCKGCTVYRDGSRSGVLISAKSDKDKKEELPPCKPPTVVEVRPTVLEADVVRFQNNKEKWVALVGLLDGRPYEIFTGLQDDDEGIIIPKSVNTGRIIKNVDENGNKRYDFQFENKRGYKMTIEGLSEKFNKEYWNYAKLISGVLRWRMPIEQVIKLVGSLQLDSENINTWKNGVERALKKYVQDGTEAKGKKCPNCGNETLVYQEGCLICTTCGASRCG